MAKGKKTALEAKSKIKKVVYDQFSTFAEDDGGGTLGAVDSMNCTSIDGILRAGVGLSIYYTANDDEVEYWYDEPKSYYIFKDVEQGIECLGIMTAYGSGFYVDEEELRIATFKNYFYYMKMYYSVNQDFENILLAVGYAGIYDYTNEEERKSDLKYIQASCMCKDRLYVVSQNHQLRYSMPLEYLSFNETLDDSGVLYLPTNYGVPKGMATFLDNVYVFYDYHIIELQAAGAARDFKMRELQYIGGMIIGDSMRVFADKLIFFAENGVYSFDGRTIRKVYERLKIFPHKSRGIFCSSVCDGKMLVRYVDNNMEDKTVALYPDGEYGYFTTVLKGVGEYKGKTFCLYKNKFYNVKDGEILPSGEFRYFRSVTQDFGVKGRKTLKKLHFEGEFSAHFDVYVDGVKKVDAAFARFEDKNKLTFDLDLRGEEFSFVIYIASKAKLWRLTAEVEYV